MTKDEWGKLNIDMIIDTNVVLCNGHERCNLIKYVSQELLHQRLGHIGKDHLNRLLKQELTYGVAVEPKSRIIDVCSPCLAGKQH